MSVDAVIQIGGSDVQVSVVGGEGPAGAAGAPGGNVMAVTLFTSLPTISIAAGVDLVRSSGYSVVGSGYADYKYDAAVDAAYVTANPRTSFRTTNSRGFKLVTDGGINVKAVGALGNGVANDAPAFDAAIAALPALGGTIHIPPGTYNLSTEPVPGTRSIFWNIDMDAVFTGAGSGENDFGYMRTNAAQLAVGPFIYSQSHQKSTNANGGIAAFNVEMIQPSDYGAGQSVAIYAGAEISCANAGANGWAINALGAAQAGALGIMTVIEVDANTNSASATVKGVSISGGGTQNADVALEIVRLSMAWDLGISIAGATIPIIITPRPTANNGVGIVIHGPTGTDVAIQGGSPFNARQFGNNKDMIFLQRFTDSAPTGYFLRCVNAANSTSPVLLDVLGNLGLGGGVTATSLTSIGSNPAGNTPLVLKNISSAANVTKYIAANFVGADTIATEKIAAQIVIDPFDTNWVNATAKLMVRRGDALRVGFQLYGPGTPEGVVTADPGSFYTNSGGGAGSTLYVKATGAGNTGWLRVQAGEDNEWSPNFSAAGDVYIPAVQAMTVSQGVAKIGSGTISFAKSSNAAPGSFSATSLPAVLEQGAWLKVTASSVTGFVATNLIRTA